MEGQLSNSALIFSSPDSHEPAVTSCSTSTSEDDSVSIQPDIANLFVLTPNSTKSDINDAIERCKNMINESDECSSERKWLVRHLIELRLRIQQIEDAEDNPIDMGFSIAGHHFELQKSIAKKQCCDHCSGIIWNVIQGCYVCKDCGYKCHPKCVKNIVRVCAHVVATEFGELFMTICPEKGLAAQQYKCAECRASFEFESEWTEPRLCDYTGLYYCTTCHWNNTCEIPARVIHNWDWEKRFVSRAAYQLLTITKNVPLINVETANKKLFNFVAELEIVRKLRIDLKTMMQYLVVCKKGNTLVTKEMISITETPKLFSMADLEEIKNDSFVHLCTLFDSCQKHIAQCGTCSGKGYLCELCGNDEIIYPFDLKSIGCKKCNSYFHRSCFSMKNSTCPKCIRLQERKNQTQSDESDDEFER